MKELEYIKSKILNDNFIKNAINYSDYKGDLKSYILTSIEEANYMLKLLDSIDLVSKNILEFGAGLGFCSTVLYMRGIKVSSFEIGGKGFESNLLLNKYIKKTLNLDYKLISNLEDIYPESYDFIFSNNVLEHVDNFNVIMNVLFKSLKSKGEMFHNVPNYLIPYEPHFKYLLYSFF